MTTGWLGRHLPILDWLPHYPKGGLGADLMAGLTTAAVAIPQAMAYATIAGLPIQAGLYAAFVHPIIYAVLGTSRPLSVTTTSTIAILTAEAIGKAAPDGDPAQLMAAGAALALIVGVMLVVASILRLGFVANFISAPVLSGFKAGVGLVILVGQLPKLFGLHIGDDGFFRKLAAIAQHLPAASVPTTALAAAVLALAFGLKRFAPRWPAPLMALAAAIAASALLGLHGMGVALVGHVPSGLPAPAVPSLSLALSLWPAALGVALMGFVETIASGRAFAAKGEPRPAADQELLAIGVAGAVGAFFGAMPAGGGTSLTAVNSKAGARTQITGFIIAAVALATMLFLAPVIELMPQAALAAVVVVAASGLIEPREFDAIRRVRFDEFCWALVTLAGVILLGTLDGVLIAIVVSLATLSYQANHPPVYALRRKPGTDVFRPVSPLHPDDQSPPGLLILRTEGRAYFANAQRISDKMWLMIHEAKPRVVLLDCSAVPDIEFTALKMLIEAEEQLREEGAALWLAQINPGMLEIIRRSSLADTLGRDRLFATVALAVEAYGARAGAAGA
jgi:sulfate permease, SulP family